MDLPYTFGHQGETNKKIYKHWTYEFWALKIEIKYV